LENEKKKRVGLQSGAMTGAKEKKDIMKNARGESAKHQTARLKVDLLSMWLITNKSKTKAKFDSVVAAAE
jgi:hypothetical protein